MLCGNCDNLPAGSFTTHGNDGVIYDRQRIVLGPDDTVQTQFMGFSGR